MSAPEFAKYKAFAMFHPFGDFRRDLQTAKIVRNICVAMSGNNNLKEIDFIPDYEDRFRKYLGEETQSGAEGEQVLKGFLARRAGRK